MFIGHYGVSFAARDRAPGVSLGWLFVAVQLVDVLFMAFLLAGVEHMRIVPGFTAFNPYDLYDMPITHSLVGALGWSVAAAIVARALRRSTAASLVVGLAVFSHFLLDVPMHTPDMTLAGAGTPRLGLGLWNHRAASLAAELAVLGAGAFVYARRRRPLPPRFFVFLAVLAAIALATPFMPPPGSVAAFAAQALAAYLGFAWWAAWVDRGARAAG